MATTRRGGYVKAHERRIGGGKKIVTVRSTMRKTSVLKPKRPKR